MEASVLGEEARSAQDAAFERFYRRYAQHVYRYTLALLRDPADAEDVTQTTFLNAYRAMRAGCRPRKPHNWLIKIAHNSCRSRYGMRRRRVVEVPLDSEVERLAAPEHEKPNIRLVLRALGRLPFNQRAALVMRELEGRSYAEIAETLGVSVSAVEMLIFRARKSMRVHARGLSALGAVQLPGSLTSFFGSGGGVAATAGAGGALGAGALVKLVSALAAATIVAGTAGVKVIADAQGTTGALSAPRLSTSEGEAPAGSLVGSGSAASGGAAHAAPRIVKTRPASLPVGPDRPSAGGADAGRSDHTPVPSRDSAPSGGETPAGATDPVSTVTKTALGTTPSLPPVQPPSVNSPQLPPPPALPDLPPVPPVPPPPELPPPPKLP